MDEKENKQVTRREFLKDAGLIVGGATVGSMALMNACTTEKTITQTQTQTTTVTAPPVTVIKTAEFAAAKSYLVSDPKKCAGCGTCMLTCSMVHEGTAVMSLARIQMMHDTFGPYPYNIKVSMCRQCANPACYQACPLKDKALCIDAATGVRYIDEKNCTGCGICALACPFTPSAITMNTAKKVALKCDQCRTTPYWDAQGRKACVEFCPQKALKVVTDKPIGPSGYYVNLRGEGWAKLGLPTD